MRTLRSIILAAAVAVGLAATVGVPSSMAIINSGWIELYCASGNGGAVQVRIRYDQTKPIGNQPIINDPVEGAALIVTNTTGAIANVIITGPDGVDHPVSIPTSGVKLSKAQLAAFGVTSRDGAGGYSLACP